MFFAPLLHQGFYSDNFESVLAAPKKVSAQTPVAGEVPTRVVQGIRIHVDMANDLDALLNAAKADGIELAGWGYRSYQRQIELRIQNCGGNDHYHIHVKSSSACNPPTARPGRSNHEIGKAVDFTYRGSTIKSQDTVPFRWMRANAAKYGFYNLPSEPWHWSVDGN